MALVENCSIDYIHVNCVQGIWHQNIGEVLPIFLIFFELVQQYYIVHSTTIFLVFFVTHCTRGKSDFACEKLTALALKIH